MPSTYYDPKQGRIVTQPGPSPWDTLTQLPQAIRQIPQRLDERSAREAADLARLREQFQPSTPPLPGAPRLQIANPWRPEPSMDDLLSPSEGPASPACQGITVDGTPDWASERAGFLARGGSPDIGRMADAMQAQAAIEENATSGARPDLLAQRQTQLALRALRNARARDEQQITQADPAFRRAQVVPDAEAEAAAALSPIARQARGLHDEEALTQARATAEQSQDLRVAPQELSRLLFDFELRRRLAEIETQGRNPLAGLLSGGGAGAPSPPTSPAGTPRVGHQRQTRDGRVVVWDGQGWAYQE